MTAAQAFERLREAMEGEKRRVERARRDAAIEGKQDEVDRLGDELQEITDDLTAMDAVQLEAIVTAELRFPSLPANHATLLAEARREVEAWEQAQRAIGTAAGVIKKVADGGMTLARIVVKYGKFLV